MLFIRVLGLVAGRDKAGAGGKKAIHEDLGVKEEATAVRELHESQGTKEKTTLERTNTLSELAKRALEWQDWGAGMLFWRLFEKYQPVLAVRYPSLRLGSAVRARVERFGRRGTEPFEPFEPFELFQNRNFPEFFLKKFEKIRNFNIF